jgi:hypothetical protein
LNAYTITSHEKSIINKQSMAGQEVTSEAKANVLETAMTCLPYHLYKIKEASE